MNTSFTSKQREVLARKLGYEGPMQGFDQYLQSSPALMMRYNAVSDKYAKRMAKGGVVGYADGGPVVSPEVASQMALYGPPYTAPASTPSATAGSSVANTRLQELTTKQRSGAALTSDEMAEIERLTLDLLEQEQKAYVPPPAPAPLTPPPQNPRIIELRAKTNRTKEETKELVDLQTKAAIDAVGPSVGYFDPTSTWQSSGAGFVDLVKNADGTYTDKISGKKYASDSVAESGAGPGVITLKAGAQPITAAPVTSPAPDPTKGGVTGGGRTTFSEEQGRAGVPLPGQAAGITPQATPITTEQMISGVGGAGTAATARTTQVGTAAQAAQPTQITAATAQPTTAAEGIQTAMAGVTPAAGAVSEQAQVKAQQGYVSPDAIARIVEGPDAAQVTAPTPLQMTEEQEAKAATVADVGGVTKAEEQVTGREFKTDPAFLAGTPEAKAATNYTLPETKWAGMDAPKVMDAAKASEIPKANEEQTTVSSTAVGQKRAIEQEELVDVAKQNLQIDEPVQATAETMSKLNEEAKMTAAQGSFSQKLAEERQGVVEAASTVAGQLEKLMSQFNDGTPAWAAGAIRQANAAMAARGLGGSSMAGAAIVQAAMEAAVPIAARDAEVFANMAMTNLNNRQQVSLVNAAAQQNLELANLNNRQQEALQNSTNAFTLQSASLSNMQQVVLANANIKAAVAEKNLDVKTQTALTNAARFAEVNNINLSNAQQAVLQRSSENLQVEFTNLSARQQTALANLQVRAAVTGQELTNEQQMAMLQSTQNFEAAGIEASNKQQAFISDFQARAALTGQVLSNEQQTALFNVSNVLQERNINLTNEQQTRLFNTTNSLQVEMANLSNKQQTALANAQIEAALKGQELTNKQQVNITNAARVAEIANVNFTADQQNALANAQFIQQINLADLNNEQASVLANAATFAAMDMANLNNRQQAAVMTAQNFLSMDMANLDREQQATLFKGQQISQALLSDAAAENAMKQFNATSQNQVDQFMVSLSTQVSQFNASQKNAIDQFNTDQANAVSKFNTEQTNARQQFNATQRLVIDQSNAQWRRDVSTADTAAVNAALYLTAQNMQAMSLAEYNNESQFWRDKVGMLFKSYESEQDRITEIARAQISAQASVKSSETSGWLDLLGNGAEALAIILSGGKK